MAEIVEGGVFMPLLQELAGLYGKHIPEEDMTDIKTIIRKYFADKYNKREELVLAEIGQTREGLGEWMRDPGK
jgi:hypothetical protein